MAWTDLLQDMKEIFFQPCHFALATLRTAHKRHGLSLSQMLNKIQYGRQKG